MENDELRRKMTLYGLTMVAVGASIGSGIFLTPSDIASELPNVWWIIGIWTLGGIISLTGALTYGELGAMFPKAGGVYVYIREAFGDLVGFLYGWVMLLVVTSGSIAALAVAFCLYAKKIFPGLELISDQILGSIVIVLLTIFNIRGVQVGQLISNIFTSAKLIGIFLIIVLGIFWGTAPVFPENATLPVTDIATACSTALIGVLWSYGGWHHTASLAGEAPDAANKVPRAMILGSIIVIVIYILANIAYVKMLSLERLMVSKAVATDALSQIWSGASFLVACLIVLSTFGTMSIYTMTAPRIYYAMAKDGIFFKQLASIHPKYKTPHVAILIQSGWSIVLLLFWGTFNNLITYVTFIDWIFLMLAAIAIFVFRQRKVPKLSNYTVPGYPITPIIFILISLWFLISTLIEKPVQALAGLIVLGLGLILYYFIHKFLTKERD